MFPPVAQARSSRIVFANAFFQKTGVAFSRTSFLPKLLERSYVNDPIKN
jgi:hypothetical protein